MPNYRYQIPSLSVLNAFECAARHGNFSRAAAELNSSQPAVSRHIATLESSLGVHLFNRMRGRVSLTPEGQRLYQSVVSGLEEIAGAVREVKAQPNTISIGCSHAVSHLWLMARYDRLQQKIGSDVEVVTVTSEYEYQPRLQEDGIDINLAFSDGSRKDENHTLLFHEEVFPVCSPDFAYEHRVLLAKKGMTALQKLPLLHLGQRNYGWSTWDTWFAHEKLTMPQQEAQPRFGNYVYMLEAACNGTGVALGWTGMVDSYLDQKRLVPLTDNRLKTTGGLYLTVNPASRNKDVVAQAATCLTDL